MINKHRNPATNKKKLPTPIVTPQATAQTNKSIAKIEKSEKTKNGNVTTKNEVPQEAPKDFIPEKASIESTASKDTKDKETATTPTNATEPTKFLSPKDLVPKLGINDKMIRIFLRKNYPRPAKGKQRENLFIERLWRTVKYKEVYLKAYQNGKDARIGIGDYFRFYNTTRPHQALGYRTPGEVFTTTVFEEHEKGVIESLTLGTIDTAGHYLNLAPLLS
jgi:hypothetical protein